MKHSSCLSPVGSKLAFYLRFSAVTLDSTWNQKMQGQGASSDCLPSICSLQTLVSSQLEVLPAAHIYICQHICVFRYLDSILENTRQLQMDKNMLQRRIQARRIVFRVLKHFSLNCWIKAESSVTSQQLLKSIPAEVHHNTLKREVCCIYKLRFPAVSSCRGNCLRHLSLWK